MSEKTIFDEKTAAWFKGKPEWYCTTVVQCKTCGLYYKASLGHKCNGKE